MAVLLATSLLVACTPPPLATPSAPAVVAPAIGTPVALVTAATAATGSPAPTAGVAATGIPAPSATSDGLGPSVIIQVDPPGIAWDSQATVTVHASDPDGIKEVAVLLGDQLLASGEEEELRLDFIPGAIDGLQGGTTYILIARGIDVSGNAAEASASITVGPAPATGSTGAAASPATPAGAAASPEAAPDAAATDAAVTDRATPPVEAPQATATPSATTSSTGSAAERGAGVITPEARGESSYRVTEISLPTYPYEPYLKQITDPELNYPVLSLDRTAYEAAGSGGSQPHGPQPQMKTHRLLVLENRYVRLGVLPDLGGRVYEFTFKPTGANEFYANPVVKPTSWGPPTPPGAAWWIGAGGLEWGFPVDEHGYEFGTVWGFDHASRDDGSVMITLFTKTGPENPYAVVDIILPPDVAYFVVQPRIVNPLGATFKFKFWANAMLAPGQANRASSDLRLSFPADRVLVHSTGDPRLPQAGETTAWPVVNGKDMSRLGNWPSYLGFFAAPATADFAGVYDPAADEGVVRVFPSSVAKGVKLFAPRGADGLDPALWTDDGSTYVELHGGLTPTFADWYELDPGAEVTWSEFWYPVARIGGLTFANDRAALALTPSANGVRLGLFPTTAITGRLTVTLPSSQPATFDVQISPEQPFSRELPLDPSAGQQGQVSVTFADETGATLFEWQGVARLR